MPRGDSGSIMRAGHQQPSTVTIDISSVPTPDLKKPQKILLQTPQTSGNTTTQTTPSLPKKIGTKALQAPQKIKVGVRPTTSSNVTSKYGNSEEIKNYATAQNVPTVNPFTIASMNTESNKDTEADSNKIDLKGFSQSPTSDLNLMGLLKLLAAVYYNVSTYKCTEALALIKKLPKKQSNTAWSLCQTGRALFESIRYADAEKAFAEALKREPYRLEGVEYYSTCLWHLKKQIELCTLANSALQISLFAPETWCAVGNCFSLQKEHETALKFFNRAVQLNPQYAYAFTLSGHEYVANEDFDQARRFYERALNVDDRHYNAWWGMGNIFLKQEKYDNAIQHFKTAIKINPRSSVLSTYLGMTYSHNRQLKEALNCFEAAERMDPHNPLNRYQKATVLMSMGQLDKALSVLEILNVQVPREAPIHILIGKIYKKMGNKEKALHHYNTAMDLDPKEGNIVKALIDKLDVENDINEENDL